MDILESIELFDCPICRGPGLLEEENGWCLYVTCLDCGCHTAALPFHSEEERIQMAKQAATTWNIGKVITGGYND